MEERNENDIKADRNKAILTSLIFSFIAYLLFLSLNRSIELSLNSEHFPIQSIYLYGLMITTVLSMPGFLYAINSKAKQRYDFISHFRIMTPIPLIIIIFVFIINFSEIWWILLFGFLIILLVAIQFYYAVKWLKERRQVIMQNTNEYEL